jgi:pimeloyl-ACP methyl ester carboxylesterase
LGFADGSPTVAQLAEMFGARSQSDAWSSIVPIQPNGCQPPFFWIHGDSSNTRLPDYLGPDRPLYALEHQAHDGRPARFTKVETIAEHYLEQMRAIRPHGPYVLGGHSFGAVVAFEMAQQLQKAHEEVALLFMLEPSTNVKPATPGLVAGMARLTAVVRRALSSVYLVRARPVPRPLRSAYILGVYERAFSAYAPRRYSGRVVIVKGQQASYRPPYHWPSLVSGRLEMHGERGQQMEMTREPWVPTWAPTLKRALDESSGLPQTLD